MPNDARFVSLRDVPIVARPIIVCRIVQSGSRILAMGANRISMEVTL